MLARGMSSRRMSTPGRRRTIRRIGCEERNAHLCSPSAGARLTDSATRSVSNRIISHLLRRVGNQGPDDPWPSNPVKWYIFVSTSDVPLSALPDSKPGHLCPPTSETAICRISGIRFVEAVRHVDQLGPWSGRKSCDPCRGDACQQTRHPHHSIANGGIPSRTGAIDGVFGQGPDTSLPGFKGYSAMEMDMRAAKELRCLETTSRTPG